MKLYNIDNVEEFLKVIDSCQGKIELITSEGDCLNMKSKLSQFVSLTKIFKETYIDEVELIAYDKDDTQKLLNYMMKG